MYYIYVQKYSSNFEYDLYDCVEDKYTATMYVQQLLRDPHIVDAYYNYENNDLETE